MAGAGLLQVTALTLDLQTVEAVVAEEEIEMTTHPHREVLMALADGEEAEYYDTFLKAWRKPTKFNPLTHPEYKWRIAREPFWQQALREASKLGETIQTKCFTTGNWVFSTLNNDPDSYVFPSDSCPGHYRTKPRITNRYLTVKLDYTGVQTEKQYNCDTLKLTFDAQTSKLIQVEILK